MKHNINFTIFLFTLCCFIISSRAMAYQSNEESFAMEISDSIYSETLGEYRDYWVKLPDNYNPKSNEKYPVVFLLDGFSLKRNLEVVYTNYWGHYLPHMILVGISNRKNRTRDLTTSKIENRRGSRFNFETGGAEDFTSFIEHDLIPNIEQTFNASNYRTLIGHSYGGLFTINMFLNHTDLFKNYIAIDPSLDWDDQKLLVQAKSKLNTESYKGKGLFVALAAEQLNMWDEKVTIDNVMEDTSEFSLFPRSILEFCDVATATGKQNKLNFDWKVYPEDLHGTVPLPAIRDGLVFLFNWYQFKNPQVYNNPETSVEVINALLNQQEIIYSQNFGYPFPPMVEELFVAYGQMYSQTEQPEKAELFLNKAIQYYPNSAMGYEAYADYYEILDNKEEAIKYLTLAHKINGKDQLLHRIEKLKQK